MEPSDDLTATFQNLSKEQTKWEKNGGLSRLGPLYVFAAQLDLQKLRVAFERGDSFALMQAIRKCCTHDFVLPEWVSRAYIKAFDTIVDCQSDSWDHVFGAPVPKGVHLAALRKKRTTKFRVLSLVNARHQARTPIDDALFEAVGEELGLGKTLCKKYYYEAKAMTGL